jgi:hypothetical protein
VLFRSEERILCKSQGSPFAVPTVRETAVQACDYPLLALQGGRDQQGAAGGRGGLMS